MGAMSLDNWLGDQPEPGDLLRSEPGNSWYMVDSIHQVRKRDPLAPPSYKMRVVRLGKGYRAKAEDHPGARIFPFHWHPRDGSRRECPHCDDVE